MDDRFWPKEEGICSVHPTLSILGTGALLLAGTMMTPKHSIAEDVWVHTEMPPTMTITDQSAGCPGSGRALVSGKLIHFSNYNMTPHEFQKDITICILNIPSSVSMGLGNKYVYAKDLNDNQILMYVRRDLAVLALAPKERAEAFLDSFQKYFERERSNQFARVTRVP